jgi:ABC-2 type transport system permease protein
MPPGIVTLTTSLTATRSASIDLASDLAFTLEIEDRLLTPTPIAPVADEKMLLADAYHVRTDHLAIPIALLVLIAFVGASLGSY